MTNNSKNVLWNQKRTDPLLLKAQFMLSAYSKSTGAHICITDLNYLTIPEIYDEITEEKNLCLYCMKQRLSITVSKNQDFFFHPCREMHINGMKNALLSGGSYIYQCELGFINWTSPIYSHRRFVGALIGGGFLGNDKQETAEKMQLLGCNESKEKLMQRLSPYPNADPQHIKALAELMLVCAEFLSQDSGDYHKILRRRLVQQKNISSELDKFKGKRSPEDPPLEYPLDKEKAFLSAVQCGEAGKACHLLNELLGHIFHFYPDDFKVIQFRVLELAVLLSRMENINIDSSNTFSDIAHQFLMDLDKAANTEELIDTLYLMTKYLAEQASSFQGIRHLSALKRAEQFIQKNYSRKISLKEIAAASGLSAPYFSTIFMKEMGENLSCYLNRMRVEKACRFLTETNIPLSEISASCGFEDQSWFSKIFKNYTGMNPAKYRYKKKSLTLEIPESELSENYKAIVNL